MYVRVVALCLALLPFVQAAQERWLDVPPVDLSALGPDDFRDDELDLPYYLAHFHRLATSVRESGPDRGFIDVAVWRAPKDNQPYNARIMENILALAYFYTTDRPWNPYRGSPAVRQRLEAALDFWCRIQADDGQFSEYAPERWNLAATAFATKFVGQALVLLADGPPIDATLRQRAIEAQRQAVHIVLTDPQLYEHGLRFSNQYTNVWSGAFALLRVRPDEELRSLLERRIRETHTELQSPVGYFYEADGPDWGYNFNTHQSNLQGAWHYTRGTALGAQFVEEERRWAEWLSYNALLEPDGSRFVLNRGIETRQQHAVLEGIPALQSSRTDLSATLKESSGRSGTGARQNKTRSVLVVAEVALALILLVGSALLIRSAIALRAVEPGFNPTNVLTMRMSLNDPRFLQADNVERLVRDGVERLRALPGVLEASATCCVPLEGGYGLPFVIAGRPLQDDPYHGGGGWVTVSAGYFEVFEIPVRAGRVYTDRDTRESPPVVVINEAMAREYWPKGDPLADRLVIGRGVMQEFAEEPERQIIGIVGDVRDGGLNNDPGPRMYVPQPQVPDAANALNVRITPMAWVIRTQVQPYSLSSAIQEALRQATGLPVSDIRSMETVVSRSTSRQRFNMWLMTVFGASALLLAAIGIYGLMAYSVQQRTQEIGIRLALGAEASQVKNMVIVQGMRLAIIGVVIGIASAFGLTRFIASFLFGVQTWDPMVFVSVPLVLSIVALVATWVPARRASRVDPIEALRYE
ncbi:MAG: FtsX-like permease family protein [Luteitalea sp.]|nr:FtsX-like permease family protein [Luteitalea sp.]